MTHKLRLRSGKAENRKVEKLVEKWKSRKGEKKRGIAEKPRRGKAEKLKSGKVDLI